MFPGGGGDHTLSQQQESLLGTDGAALQDDEVLSHDTVVRETTQRSDVLLGDIVFSGGVVLDTAAFALSDSVDLLVEFGSVEETFLTSSGDSPGDSGRMPGTDTSDLSVTSVGFLLQVTGSPSLHDTGESFTFGDTDNVDEFVLGEHLVDSDLLLEVLETEVDFLSDVLSAVDLDFEDVVPLLSETLQKVLLSVGDDSHNGAVLFDSVELGLNSLGVLGDLGLVVGEGLSLGVVPVLVESSEGALVQVLGPDGGEGSQASGGVDVADQTHDLERGGLDDGHGLNLLLLVEFSLGSVDVSEDVGHAGLEASEGSEVGSLVGIISGEGSDSSAEVSGSLSGAETEVTFSGATEFSVRHSTPLTKYYEYYIVFGEINKLNIINKYQNPTIFLEAILNVGLPYDKCVGLFFLRSCRFL